MEAESLTPSLHRQLLRQYVVASAPDPTGARSLAARFELLPVYFDWSGFIGLGADGGLRFVAWDPPQRSAAVRDPRVERIALAAAAKRYRELAFLRPLRPADAIPCPSCGGTGEVDVNGVEVPPNVVCYCGGLGWIRPEEQAGFSSPGA